LLDSLGGMRSPRDRSEVATNKRGKQSISQRLFALVPKYPTAVRIKAACSRTKDACKHQDGLGAMKVVHVESMQLTRSTREAGHIETGAKGEVDDIKSLRASDLTVAAGRLPKSKRHFDTGLTLTSRKLIHGPLGAANLTLP
jgi:hypothetical protein